MEIILLKTHDILGDKHDVVTVKPGYARNYLIPNGMAVIANASNMKKLDRLKAKEEALEAAKVGEYQALAETLKEKVLKIGAKAGTSGKIFGSVTNIQLATALKEQLDIEIPRRKITFPEEVKTLGTYQADISLHADVPASVQFEVVQE